MSLIHVVVLAIIQGLAELLPVSSSAHVVVAEKLMGLDPSAPALTLLLVLLHTGTMFAVIVYFWRQWRATYFSSREAFVRFAYRVVIATALTGVIGYGLAKLVVRAIFPGAEHAEVEQLFSHLELIAPALFAVGILIIVSDVIARRNAERAPEKLAAYRGATSGQREMTLGQSAAIGFAQALALPFRGFSRSGATISTGMLAGVDKVTAEAFSFALAVVLTPPVVVREILRLHRQGTSLPPGGLHAAVWLSVLGGVLAFLAGLVALKWLSAWLERGRWIYFGVYCLVAAAVVEALHVAGF
ncbi:MAG: undecaprenyl-diphosphate phosphatase [Steroidobacteraceae bacterium]